ncbi:hypothetical protein D1631_14035 [Chryseobacterium nematophagum]|uniref:Uncharacterized protein n=1 Tax=Chryseobacterium nematophagum TaxID=2305228 RepID=A0A3M7THG4_9FLAO|nr:hypothetical protein [Chryseobacterium nematophagum]RNA62971.1 hypothetical protein D1631_14035 [Chryseobacterium nematophagum]
MRSAETFQNLTRKIFKVTTKIQSSYPELYFLLNETPLFMSSNEANITVQDLKQYLTTIRMQLITFEKDKKMKL